jgi:hypothetical protein
MEEGDDSGRVFFGPMPTTGPSRGGSSSYTTKGYGEDNDSENSGTSSAEEQPVQRKIKKTFKRIQPVRTIELPSDRGIELNTGFSLGGEEDEEDEEQSKDRKRLKRKHKEEEIETPAPVEREESSSYDPNSWDEPQFTQEEERPQPVQHRQPSPKPKRKRKREDDDEEGEEEDERPQQRSRKNVVAAATQLMHTGGMALENNNEGVELDPAFVPKFSFIWRMAEKQLGALPENHWKTCFICNVLQMENKAIIEKGAMSKVFKYIFDNCSKINEIMFADNVTKEFETIVRKPGNDILENRKWIRVQKILFRHKIKFDVKKGLKGLEDIEMDDPIIREIEGVIRDFNKKLIEPLNAMTVFAHFRIHTVELPYTLLRKARDHTYLDHHLHHQLNFLTPDEKIGVDNPTFKMWSKNGTEENKFYCSKFSNSLFQPNLNTESAIRSTLAGPPEALMAMNPTTYTSVSMMIQGGQVNLYNDHIS